MIPVTKIVLKGENSAQYIRFAHNQLAILERQMSFQNLNEGRRVVSPFPGIFVECLSRFGQKEVRILTTTTKSYIDTGNIERQRINVIEELLELDKYFIIAKAGDKSWSVKLSDYLSPKLSFRRINPPIDVKNDYEFTQVRYTSTTIQGGKLIVSAVSIWSNNTSMTSFYGEFGVPSLKELPGGASISSGYDEIYQIYLNGANRYTTKCYGVNTDNDKWEIKKEYSAPTYMTPISKATEEIYHPGRISIGRDGLTTTFLIFTSSSAVYNTWENPPTSTTAAHPCVEPWPPLYPNPRLVTQTFNESKYITSSIKNIISFNSINAKTGALVSVSSYVGLSLVSPSEINSWDFKLSSIGKFSSDSNLETSINGYYSGPDGCYYWNRLEHTSISRDINSRISNAASQIEYAGKIHSEASYIPVLASIEGDFGDCTYFCSAEMNDFSCNELFASITTYDTRSYKSDIRISNSYALVKINKQIESSIGTANYLIEETNSAPCIPVTGVAQWNTISAALTNTIGFSPLTNQIHTTPYTTKVDSIDYTATSEHVDVCKLDFPFEISDISTIEKSFISTDQHTNITFFGVKYSLRSDSAISTWKVAVCFNNDYLSAIDITEQLRVNVENFDDDFEMLYFYAVETEIKYKKETYQ